MLGSSGMLTFDRWTRPLHLLTWVGCLSISGCASYLNHTQEFPALTPVPAQRRVVFLGAKYDQCLGKCEHLEDGVRAGLETAFKEQLGWRLETPPRSCQQAKCVEFQPKRTCLVEGYRTKAWTVAARVKHATSESRGDWASDLLFGDKSQAAIVRIVLWDNTQRTILDHDVIMSVDNDEDESYVNVSPKIPRMNPWSTTVFDPDVSGSSARLAQDAARVGLEALSLALKPEVAKLQLIFDDGDARTEQAIALAEDGKLSAAHDALSAIEPKSPSVHHNLGLISLGLGKDARRHPSPGSCAKGGACVRA